MTDLVRKDPREAAVERLRRFFQAELTVLFIEDAEVGTYIPAPGFPKTLQNVHRWWEFVASCRVHELYRSKPEISDDGSTVRSIVGIRGSDGSVLVAIGDSIDEDAVAEAGRYLPIVAAALQGESLSREAAESARVARQSASQISLMARSLDKTRRDLQRALQEASHAKKRLEGELQQRVLVEEELRRLNESLEMRIADRTADLEEVNERLRVENAGRVEAQRALESANEILRQSNRNLQDFAYVASHDLKEPLRKIISFTDLLEVEVGSQLNESANDFMDRIRRSALRMTKLINDLLEFSKLTSVHHQPETVKLAHVVEDVVEDLELQIREAGAQVTVDELPTIRADALQMRQLFQNLISNAIKYHHAGRRPKIRVRMGDGTEDVCRILVEDNGIGFEERYIDRIFTPFQRLNTGVDVDRGTGIGLAICRQIVERHGGTINARSKPGSGSTFIVTLPLDRRAAPLEKTSPPDQIGPGLSGSK